MESSKDSKVGQYSPIGLNLNIQDAVIARLIFCNEALDLCIDLIHLIIEEDLNCDSPDYKTLVAEYMDILLHIPKLLNETDYLVWMMKDALNTLHKIVYKTDYLETDSDLQHVTEATGENEDDDKLQKKKKSKNKKKSGKTFLTARGTVISKNSEKDSNLAQISEETSEELSQKDEKLEGKKSPTTSASTEELSQKDEKLEGKISPTTSASTEELSQKDEKLEGKTSPTTSASNEMRSQDPCCSKSLIQENEFSNVSNNQQPSSSKTSPSDSLRTAVLQKIKKIEQCIIKIANSENDRVLKKHFFSAACDNEEPSDSKEWVFNSQQPLETSILPTVIEDKQIQKPNVKGKVYTVFHVEHDCVCKTIIRKLKMNPNEKRSIYELFYTECHELKNTGTEMWWCTKCSSLNDVIIGKYISMENPPEYCFFADVRETKF